MSLVALAAAGCKGEQALFARDANAWSGLGGNGLVTGSGGTGNAGTGGTGMAGHGGRGRWQRNHYLKDKKGQRNGAGPPR